MGEGGVQITIRSSSSLLLVLLVAALLGFAGIAATYQLQWRVCTGITHHQVIVDYQLPLVLKVGEDAGLAQDQVDEVCPRLRLVAVILMHNIHQ